MTVMIVDDNALMRSAMRRLLDRTVDAFCECSDGSEALSTYAKFHPDWVLMDIKMNRMDGFQATKEILSSFPDAKIIMVTQYDEPVLHEKAMRGGVKEFVLKENLSEIENIIRARDN